MTPHRTGISIRLPMLLVPTLVGCATLPNTGVKDSGEPLSLYTGTVTEQHAVKEKVGEVEHKTSDGKLVGTSDVYQDRIVTTQRQIWYPKQGDRRLDDQDFFRLAGDDASAEEIASYRETGVVMNRVGLALAAAGAVALGTGYYLLSRNTVQEDGTVDTKNAGLARGLMIGGGVGVTIGGTGAYLGLARVSPDAHPVNLNRAQGALRLHKRKSPPPGEKTARR